MMLIQIMKRGLNKILATHYYTSAHYGDTDRFKINIEVEGGNRGFVLELTAEDAARIYLHLGSYFERRKQSAV